MLFLLYFQIACTYQISFMTEQLNIILEHFYFIVHTHTQWPTWHEDDRKYWILWCCKFYMSYGTLSVYFKIHRYQHSIRWCDCLCEKISSESFTWLHNHSSWQRAVYGGHPCPMDTFLVFMSCPVLLISVANFVKTSLLYVIL